MCVIFEGDTNTTRDHAIYLLEQGDSKHTKPVLERRELTYIQGECHIAYGICSMRPLQDGAQVASVINLPSHVLRSRRSI